MRGKLSKLELRIRWNKIKIVRSLDFRLSSNLALEVTPASTLGRIVYNKQSVGSLDHIEYSQRSTLTPYLSKKHKFDIKKVY